jgi:hypothetical protein
VGELRGCYIREVAGSLDYDNYKERQMALRSNWRNKHYLLVGYDEYTVKCVSISSAQVFHGGGPAEDLRRTCGGAAEKDA